MLTIFFNSPIIININTKGTQSVFYAFVIFNYRIGLDEFGYGDGLDLRVGQRLNIYVGRG